MIDYSKEDKMLFNKFNVGEPDEANRGLSFDEMMNKIAPLLDRTPDAHALAEKIITALFGERP